MTLAEGLEKLVAAGLAADIKRDLYPPYLFGGMGRFESRGVKGYSEPAFRIEHHGKKFSDPNLYKAATTLKAQMPDEEHGDLEHCVDWVIGRLKK